MRRFDHFDLVAPIYDRLFRLGERDELREVLRLPVEGWILDAGGGTGRVTEALCGQANRIVVVDPSTGMLEQTRGKPCLEATRGLAEVLPFPDGAFERILVVDAFHHFCDQRQAAAELMRVLAPGGRLVVEEPNIETWPVKLIAMGERLALMRSRFLSPADMRQMFEGLGGRVEVRFRDLVNAWVVVDK